MAKPNYTMDSNVNGMFSGWPRKGINRYNDLIKATRRNIQRNINIIKIYKDMQE